MYRIAAAAVVVLVLAGCTPAATADPTTAPATTAPTGTPSVSPTVTAAPTASPTPSTTPAPAPTDDATAQVTDLVLTARSLVAKGSTGAVVLTVKYLDDPTRAVKKLTALFGETPRKTTTQYDRTYSWGGFTMRVSRASHEGWSAADIRMYPRIFVTTSAATVGDISLHTADGVRVGDSAREVAAANPKAVDYDKDPQTGKKRLQLFLDPYRVGTSISGGALTQSVWALTDSPTGKIVEIRTPSPNYGD